MLNNLYTRESFVGLSSVVGVFPKNRLLSNQQNQTVPSDVTTLPHDVAPALHRLGRPGLSQFGRALSRLPRRGPERLPALNERNPTGTQQKPTNFGALHRGRWTNRTNHSQWSVIVHRRSQSSMFTNWRFLVFNKGNSRKFAYLELWVCWGNSVRKWFRRSLSIDLFIRLWFTIWNRPDWFKIVKASSMYMCVSLRPFCLTPVCNLHAFL